LSSQAVCSDEVAAYLNNNAEAGATVFTNVRCDLRRPYAEGAKLGESVSLVASPREAQWAVVALQKHEQALLKETFYRFRNERPARAWYLGEFPLVLIYRRITPGEAGESNAGAGKSGNALWEAQEGAALQAVKERRE
jgi:hypothetical protein